MRVIQAGVGGFGGSWLWAVRDCQGFEHVALVDPSPAGLQSAGEAIGVPPERRFARLEDALANFEADGFINVTPAPFHEATTLTALDVGLHVLVEKPISDTMRYLLGSNAKRVQAQTWNPPFSNTEGDMSAFAWIEFQNGVRVNYTSSFCTPGQDTGWSGRWVITGSRGSLVWNPHDDWGPIRLYRQTADLSAYAFTGIRMNFLGETSSESLQHLYSYFPVT